MYEYIEAQGEHHCGVNVRPTLRKSLSRASGYTVPFGGQGFLYPDLLGLVLLGLGFGVSSSAALFNEVQTHHHHRYAHRRHLHADQRHGHQRPGLQRHRRAGADCPGRLSRHRRQQCRRSRQRWRALHCHLHRRPKPGTT